MAVEDGNKQWRRTVVASDEPGAWRCSACGFRGFWEGGPHCTGNSVIDALIASAAPYVMPKASIAPDSPMRLTRGRAIYPLPPLPFGVSLEVYEAGVYASQILRSMRPGGDDLTVELWIRSAAPEA